MLVNVIVFEKTGIGYTEEYLKFLKNGVSVNETLLSWVKLAFIILKFSYSHQEIELVVAELLLQILIIGMGREYQIPLQWSLVTAEIQGQI